MSRPKNVVASPEVPEQSHDNGPFQVRRRRLGAAAGGDKLGCSLVEVAPGKSSWPSHFHLANEEAIYVLEGTGTLRLGEERCALQAGDYVALPIGPPGHRIDNTSGAPLRYLALSTMIEPEVVLYPDTGKIGTSARKAAGLVSLHRQDAQVDYWEGER